MSGWFGRTFGRKPGASERLAASLDGRVSPCPDCSGPNATELTPREVRYWLRLTREPSGGYALTCSHCGGSSPVPPQMIDWAIQSVEGVNKLLGPEVGAVQTPWGVKSKAELAEALEQTKTVERLDRSNIDRAKLETHVAAHHGIGRAEQRQQTVGLVLHFHQQAHAQMPQNHAEADLRE